MKSAVLTRRIPIALLALASLGALVAARPAAAQPAVRAVVASQPAVVAVDRGHGWEQRHRRDQRAPQITQVTPSHGDRIGERGFAHISARVEDFGSGIDARSVTLRVDGRDVSRRTRFDGDDVRYSADLAPGRHWAELVVRDRAGNAARRAWAFDVIDRGRHYGWNR